IQADRKARCKVISLMFDVNEDKLAAALRTHVDRLAGLIGPRPPIIPKAFDAAATYVERQLAEAGYTVERQKYLAGEREVANLIAEYADRFPGMRLR
ncbi:MAG TPA: hypothetical protein VH107_12680, partial [Lacipirellulaceae bacterium]|nr:hypothetical protein [Lacipirellulaceae bacterium]